MDQEKEARAQNQTGETALGRLSTQHIGRLGELLLQYELLRYGIDSAALTTDSGIDLVAYSKVKGRPFTIQVKSNLGPKPGGGKGSLALDWWLNEKCPAELIAFAEIASRRIWLFTKEEVARLAQQRSNGRLHLYISVDARSKLSYQRHGEDRFSAFLIEKRVVGLFLEP
jgi:hypothetical protein